MGDCFIFFLFLQIVLEGVVGGGYRGDIAIDDISMTPGQCSQSMAFIFFYLGHCDECTVYLF